MLFEMLFAPVTMEAFVREYFEKAPLHIGRNDPNRFSAIYGVDDVEEALAIGHRETGNFALVKAGSPELPLEQYGQLRPAIRARSTGKAPVAGIDARKVAEFFGQGYTLVIKDASLFSVRMQRFCSELQAETGWYVQPNVYLTPGAAQGFDIHYDTHDTLIAQIEGEKTWRIYEPVVQLPLESQPFSAAAHQGKLRLVREILMQPGDTLYIPGGFPHEANSPEGRALHVTFAMLELRAIDLLEQMLALAATRNPALRRALPPGWHDDPDFAQTFTEQIAPALREAFSAQNVAAAREGVLLEYYGAARIDSRAAFDRIQAAARVDPAQTLRRRADLPVSIRESSQGLAILLPGRSLAMPDACLPALRRLERGPCVVGELPGLAQPNQLWLARVLLTYGAGALS